METMAQRGSLDLLINRTLLRGPQWDRRAISIECSCPRGVRSFNLIHLRPTALSLLLHPDFSSSILLSLPAEQVIACTI